MGLLRLLVPAWLLLVGINMTTRRKQHPNEQHIGDADGRIALWLNEQGAHDLADVFGVEDKAREELLDAIERAYPKGECPDGWWSKHGNSRCVLPLGHAGPHERESA